MEYAEAVSVEERRVAYEDPPVLVCEDPTEPSFWWPDICASISDLSYRTIAGANGQGSGERNGFLDFSAAKMTPLENEMGSETIRRNRKSSGRVEPVE